MESKINVATGFESRQGARMQTKNETMELPIMLPRKSIETPKGTVASYYLIGRIGDFGLYEFTNCRMGGKSLAVFRAGTLDGSHKSMADRTTAAKYVQSVKECEASGVKFIDYKTKDGWPGKFARWEKIEA